MSIPVYPLGRIFVVDDNDISKVQYKTLAELVPVIPTGIGLLDLNDSEETTYIGNNNFAIGVASDSLGFNFQYLDYLKKQSSGFYASYSKNDVVSASTYAYTLGSANAIGSTDSNTYYIVGDNDNSAQINLLYSSVGADTPTITYSSPADFIQYACNGVPSNLPNTGCKCLAIQNQYLTIPNYYNLIVDVHFSFTVELRNVDDNFVLIYVQNQSIMNQIMNNGQTDKVKASYADHFFQCGASDRLICNITKRMSIATGANSKPELPVIACFMRCVLKNTYKNKNSFDAELITANMNMTVVGIIQ